ncbi:MAG: hypothetical protein GF418_10195 [Chitinivibrionales bacterium]|nr:hypothetical protein [Chitinivibrionales bacterium]MBD3395983.1 hypothetical protein [Chitinivibrionales bacterium]
MLLQPAQAGGFQILRILQDTVSEEDAVALLLRVEELLAKNNRKIALSFNSTAYPYSKLISVITRCYQEITRANGTLAVILPSAAFARAADSVNLSSVVRIVSSEDELR